MNVHEYNAALGRVTDHSAGYEGWNARYLQALEENGLKLVPVTDGPPPEPWMIQAPWPTEEAFDRKWPDSYIVPV